MRGSACAAASEAAHSRRSSSHRTSMATRTEEPSIATETSLRYLPVLELGLKPVTGTLLHAQLHRCSADDAAAAELALTQFVVGAHEAITEHAGLVVHCVGDLAVALWKSRTPVAALGCALALREALGNARQPHRQVVRTPSC